MYLWCSNTGSSLSCNGGMGFVMAGLILEILEELRKEDFEKFTLYLSENVVEGCSPISWEQLEDKGTSEQTHTDLRSASVSPSVTAEAGGDAVDYTEQAPTDLRSASLNPSVTAEAGGNAVDYTEQALTNLRSVPCNSSITAQTGASVAAPQVHGCSVAGNMTVNVNIQPDNKGVEHRTN
ncbi:hypothetical protein JZ751_027464 [Albula glossodonta]|uniref:Pyrin domain-containing protein n=1 Tax=Albula glossodonta TaxID=121402 RepID=A0A8T2MPR0_9TELE|nr:hypothetical protein JZ751_027464 [Albula glossodonta]